MGGISLSFQSEIRLERNFYTFPVSIDCTFLDRSMIQGLKFDFESVSNTVGMIRFCMNQEFARLNPPVSSYQFRDANHGQSGPTVRLQRTSATSREEIETKFVWTEFSPLQRKSIKLKPVS